MARIRFLSDQVYDTGGPGKGPRFAAGFVLDEKDVGKVLGIEADDEFSAAFLNRWVRRNVAVFIDTPADDPAKVEAVAPAPVAVAQPLGTAGRGRPTAGLDDGKPVEVPDLQAMSRAKLEALAEARGVDISDARNKGDIIAAIELDAE